MVMYSQSVRSKLTTARSRPRRLLERHNRFSQSAPRLARYAYPGLKVNRDRLWADIHETCQWGTGERWGEAPHETGMSRLALTAADKHARDWFVDTTRALGCRTTVDAMGNIFAVRPGKAAGPPTCAGSHLDTQPAGGRYDGILGVCAGVEMLKTFAENRVETEFPVGVVNWTNEEGARFPISMVSSGVWAGDIPLEKAHGLREVGEGGRTMKEELESIGYLGDVAASYEASPIAAHFELHIEQGPKLETEKKKIGIVKGVQAYNWHTLTVHGRSGHTGTTPMALRSDALLHAAALILSSRSIAITHSSLASTGIVSALPGSVNTIPGSVRFSLDLRAATDEKLAAMEAEMRDVFGRMAPDHGFELEWATDSRSRAAAFDEGCVSCVEKAAGELVGEGRLWEEAAVMTSGAGHDSVFTSRRAPTAMIFVPCKDGVSHNPREFCGKEDCANGAQVLIGSVLGFDGRRTK